MAAEFVKAQLLLKPESTLGLPTGRTAIGMYEQLVDTYRNNQVSFSKVTTF